MPEKSDLKDRIRGDLEDLKRIRDEIKVRIHLAGAEARDLWDSAEKKIDDADARLQQFLRGAKEPLADVGNATELLADEIGRAYRKIRDLL